jgi:Lon protease-like protein
MSRILPLFPLNLVVFPEEIVSLHIFEQRYRQLVRDCQQEHTTFGIPAFIDEAVQDWGTELRLSEIVNQYPDGRMDIRCEAISIFHIRHFQNPLPEKLYAGGEIEDMPVEDSSILSERILLLEQVDKLFDLIGHQHELEPEEQLLSFKLGHHLGLSTKQEYHLLTLPTESDRITFLIDHLTRSLPIMKEMERTKQKVRMNGHFKHFDPLKF